MDSNTTSRLNFPTSAGQLTANVSQHRLTSLTLSEGLKDLKDEIHRRQQALAQHQETVLAPNESELIESLPARVQDYVDLYPIKRPTSIGGRSNLISSVFGCVTSIYRATNLNNNVTVFLKRVHSFQPSASNQSKWYNIIDAWKNLQCATMVRLLQVFTTKEFGDSSLVLVYQYFPQTISLMQQYFNDPQSNGIGPGNYGYGAANRPYSQQNAMLKSRLLAENLLWHYIIQISLALRHIHSKGLAYRTMDPSKILITQAVPKGPPYHLQPTSYPRIRLNYCGLFDLISLDHQELNHEAMQQHQQEDLIAFGKLCLALATNNLANAKETQMNQAMDLVTRTYSNDLRILICTLLSTQHPQDSRPSINDIMPMIGARFYVQLNLSYDVLDTTQAELDHEALNGKLFRLLIKLSMINDRPELRMDHTWSETGDRYMLKLFREYLFHQVAEDGSPWLDMGHVVSTLIKFDTGSQEKICLISRDEQHVLVVSFAELKKCFESAFNELQS